MTMPTRLALCLLLPAALVAADKTEVRPLKTEADARALVESCLKQFVAGDYKAGLDLLKPHWKVSLNEIDTLTMQTITSRTAVKERFGASIGYEFIAQQKAGTSFLRFLAVEKLQNTAIRYSVVFYKATDHWELQTFVWDDKVQNLFGD
ncbi:hypothetical protein [Geothrix oryzisoli]|uniref:hypothetical protein n=1 Tax=Geothrix oryzisoli TaxID=2922721 RepID=UPI001FACAF8E|nr:hypothetical protein [Geothrix oryzisoli]